MTDIERTLARLRGRLRRVGARPLRTPPDTIDLDALVEAIAPLELPEAVETWWRSVEVASFPMQPFPRPCRPDHALRTWTEHTGVVPRCLVPVASDSATVLAVDVSPEAAGDVVSWAVEDPELFEYVATGWDDILECYVDVIDAGAYELRRGMVMPEPEILDGALRARRSDVVLPARYPARRMRFAGPNDWPAHWRPHGRTLTIGEILAAPHGTRLRGTIVGRVVGLVGGAAGALAIVDDRSGRLDIWCPAATCTWGPRLEGVFEFDIEAHAEPVGQREATTAAFTRDPSSVTDTGGEFSHHHPSRRPAATATAIRPAA